MKARDLILAPAAALVSLVIVCGFALVACLCWHRTDEGENEN